MRFTDMTPTSSLLIDRHDGEQVVRPPRRWDAIGALLQRVYAVHRAIPDPIARLLPRMETKPDAERISGRR
ncbi:hypothetical protein [Sphingomonas rubra]|uniref:Uncharacterized protein n=1 Tax=Sphingomonas rubra TaxID=634430 RepID=A0A1I5PKP1_9SPHN|nr:hypothetical protein [Sphingomonas rubra]SFP34589.1 hypothetical protein SAMN04488241_10177 [Sphingomonas rubra]